MIACFFKMRLLFCRIVALGGCLFPLLGNTAPRIAAWDVPGALRFSDNSTGAIVHDADGRPALLIPAPTAVPADSLRKTLPNTVKKLRSGEPYTILAIGDSVTATGPYPEILGMLLGRATGHPAIQVRRAAYSGRSVDAAVRRFEKDVAPVKADLALIMFGLNDQAASSPLEAYLEQTRWLVKRLREQGADVVLMEPTPHINIIPMPGDKEPPPAEASIFRTVGFAAALRELGTELGAPVVPTFDALWGAGGVDLLQSAQNAWPLFPTHYSKPFSNMVETQGKGDTIHPNVQGHLKLAQAVLATLAGRNPVAPLRVAAETRIGQDGRLIAQLTLRNNASGQRQGSLAVYPFPQDDTHERLDYALAEGEAQELTFVWPETVRLGGPLWLQVVDYHAGHSRAWAVPAELQPAVRWARERSVVAEPNAVARLLTGGSGVREVPVSWPGSAQVGRIPLAVSLTVKAEEVPAQAELVYTRYAAALSGEAVLDGDLSEWADATWVPVGEPSQARWTKGPADYRATPAECYLHWAFRAGTDGVWLAFRATGELSQDQFTLYFDHRPAALLGSAGPYSWVDGRLNADGTMTLRPGDSSPAGRLPELQGRWRAAGEDKSEGELFVPYAVLNALAWPEDGDLGASIVWMHAHADGRVTRLMWSENGHPWNTRWFGVVRRDPAGPLPWRVRVQ